MVHAPATLWEPIDAEPLTAPVTRADEDAYRARHEIDPARRMHLVAAAHNALSPVVAVLLKMVRWGVGRRGAARVLLSLLGGIGAAIGFVVVLAVVVFLAVGAVLGPLMPLLALMSPEPDAGRILESLLLLPVTVAVIALVRWHGGMFVRNQRRAVRRGVAVERLAAANGLAFTRHRLLREERPGSLFSVGDPMGASELVARAADPSFEIGTWTFNRSLDPKQRTWVLERWGFAALRLPARLPHILLDARSQNGLLTSSLPGLSAPAEAQRFGLEGDFDRHFALHCPVGYEVDALYLFTPDVMAHLVDSAARYDVEIVDDWLFLYAPRELPADEPADWRAMDEALRALAAKIDQWGRWRDDRLRRGSTGVRGSGADAAEIPEPAAEPARDSHPASGAPMRPAGAAPRPVRRAQAGPAREGRRLKNGAPIGAIVLAIIGLGAAALIVGEDIVAGLSWIGSLF